jgi:hypothetical protein
MDIERCFRHAGLAGDRIHAGAFESDGHEQGSGGIQDLPVRPVLVGVVGVVSRRTPSDQPEDQHVSISIPPFQTATARADSAAATPIQIVERVRAKARFSKDQETQALALA